MGTLKDAMYAKFEDIPTRRGRGGHYQYIRWQDVADRMNSIFGCAWTSEVVFQDIIGPNVIVRVRVTVKTDEGVFSQEGFGGAPDDNSGEAGNSFKSAYSKALKDACKRWGVGLYLDEDDSSDKGMPNMNVPAPSMSAPMSAPASMAMPLTQPTAPAPNMNFKETGVPSAPQMLKPFEAAPPVVAPTPDIKTAPAATAPVGNMMPPPGIQPLPNIMPPVNASIMPEVERTLKSPEEALSVMPTASTQAGLQAPAVEMPAPKAPPISMGGADMISDVQKAALQSLLRIIEKKGVDYVGLVNDALTEAGISKTEIPPLEELTYQEAVTVIKYGNGKFRGR